ncbi:RNA polymerase sigma-70 factor (ECF subfamily) [Herbihabitans rhizosphaerae]|uniref:RNA polymerase sigma factor n=1 Tax=Herbihabitans rhizosphaerae TaxID=1872711 RepID=A0A4Q7L9J3_9PSEU|nr:RNA polymerase sigma-70 factor (ECF subfamily) [Herbihabitans rhizosphaerae]
MTTADFATLAEPYRRELIAHCYRMIGSVADAEDLVQETYLRAWRGYDRFEGRSSLRTWLYQIATNVCLTAAGKSDRRVLPSGIAEPSGDPHGEPRMAGAETLWLQPIPDSLVADPAATVAARDSLRLALIACLQGLPSSQRAVLLLRDVVGLRAAEVAEALDTSVAAVKSTLQRARARLAELRDAAGDTVDEPAEPERKHLLERYMRAFETSDVRLLERILREDASLQMPPAATWFSGKSICVPFFAASALGEPGDWRMLPTSANGQPAAAAYLRGEDGVYRAYGVAVLTVTTTGLAEIIAFGDPSLVTRFGFPSVSS